MDHMGPTSRASTEHPSTILWVLSTKGDVLHASVPIYRPGWDNAYTPCALLLHPDVAHVSECITEWSQSGPLK